MFETLNRESALTGTTTGQKPDSSGTTEKTP